MELKSAWLLGGDEWSTLAARALGSLTCDRSSLLLIAGQAERSDVVAATRGLLNQPARELTAPNSVIASFRQWRGQQWTSLDLHGRGQRLENVVLPTAVDNAQSVILVNDLAGHDPKRPAIAIGAWAQFAHPRLRVGAVLGDPVDGLAAEIALAAPAACYVLGASWRGKPMLAASNDMVAAELIGLAIGQAQSDPNIEHAGPWENALVQRATDLGLGARTPAEISFHVAWLGAGEERALDFERFGEIVAGRIGVHRAP